MNFATPFPGKPAKPHLSGLFMLDPSALLKLAGNPMQAMMKDTLGDALAKRIERATRDNSGSMELLEALAAALPPEHPQYLAQLCRAVNGDATAIADMSRMGLWEHFYLAAGDELGYGGEYRLAIERASRSSEAAYRIGDYRGCAKRAEKSALLKPLLWPDAIGALKRAKQEEDAIGVRFAVAMEVELSWLAALDIQVAEGSTETAGFSVLFSDSVGDLNPSAMFFRWLRQATGLPTISAIECSLSRAGTPIHLVTLKNWSRGSQLPSPSWLRLLVTLCPTEADRQRAEKLIWAARHLNFLGFYAAKFAKVAQSRLGDSRRDTRVLRPALWPRYPFGHDTFVQWARERYPFWLAYHRARFSAAQKPVF